MKKIIAIYSLLISVHTFAQEGDPKLTEVWTPVPKAIMAGKTCGDAPSDAIILFDGKNFNEWVHTRDSTKQASWTIHDNYFTVKKGTGNIQTKRKFLDYQLHIEWLIPEKISGEGQSRGNSGIFLAAFGRGDAGYELQVLDSYNNATYVNGQAGSIYKQSPPLVNANRPPGQWQYYDIVWTAPRFNDDGSLKSPARVTVFLNGILIQNNTELAGPTLYIGKPAYRKHGAASIKLQDHGDPSEPISYRNIWIRELNKEL